MLARYYSAGLSRFLSVDPGDDSDPEDPQSWNKYAYVRNNPLKYLDPDGEAPQVNSQVKTYQTTGNTAAEALASASASHGGQAGSTTWSMGVTKLESVEIANVDLGSAVSTPTDVTVSVEVTISLPEWNAPSSAAPGEQQAFDKAVDNLESHERGHEKIAIAGGATLESQVKGLVGTGKGVTPGQAKASARQDLRAKAQKATSEQVSRTKQRQSNYDRKTGHGTNK